MVNNKPEGSASANELRYSQPDNGARVSTSSTRANQLLRQARKARTWSQAELAERIGVAKETISRWENGVSRPQPQQLGRLCETFGMKPDELGYALDQEEESPAAIVESPRPPSMTGNTGTTTIEEAPPTTAEKNPEQSGAQDARVEERRTLPRRRFLVAGGIALGALALTGGTMYWFANEQQLPTSPRQWPSVKYDIGHVHPLTRVVQYMLRARQYDLGPAGVDGAFGPATLDAVKTFQKNAHLPDDGVVDSNTWDQLIVTVDSNSRGSAAQALQECLNQAHLGLKLSEDATMGPQTITAMHRFQQTRHLPIKDSADKNFWCLLVGGKCKCEN